MENEKGRSRPHWHETVQGLFIDLQTAKRIGINALAYEPAAENLNLQGNSRLFGGFTIPVQQIGQNYSRAPGWNKWTDRNPRRGKRSGERQRGRRTASPRDKKIYTTPGSIHLPYPGTNCNHCIWNQEKSQVFQNWKSSRSFSAKERISVFSQKNHEIITMCTPHISWNSWKLEKSSLFRKNYGKKSSKSRIFLEILKTGAALMENSYCGLGGVCVQWVGSEHLRN